MIARLLIALLALAASAAKAEEVLTVASPDGDITVSVSDDGGELSYSVSYKGETVVGASRLGMRFKDQHGFDDNLAIVSFARASADETWEQPWGERRFVTDRHNELAVEVAAEEGPARTLFVRFRVFDDGVGFRYEAPKQRALKSVEIIDELTEFALEKEADAWWIPSRHFNRYEYLYRTTKAHEVDTAHTPATFRLQSGVHLSIHEAALVDYAGMSLKPVRHDGRFEADLAQWSDGARVKTKTPFATPWRTIQIAPDAAGLVNSDLILNLNEPNKLGDVAWVEPGKYVGVWWAMHINERTWGADGIHGATTEEAKRYIDFAAENGFSGVLVEGWNIGWDGDWYENGDVFSFTESYPDFDLAEVASYARDKDVRLIGHHETSGGVSNYENQMADAFALYESLGVRQVKTGYVADYGDIKRIDDDGVAKYEAHDGQFMARHHLRVVKEAAKHKISINAHEPIKDTGLRRTYPNWITREGARGQEFNAWGDPPNSPEHTAILPFTRMLSGPMDFTPGIFDLEPNKRAPVREDMPRGRITDRVQTTLAKQLALYVVIYSPIQMAADLPENYEARPDAFQFIRDVPVDWAESRAIAGEIGDYVAIARKDRAGDDWYLGALTDENARDVEISLSFLDEDAVYVAEIYRDGADADWRDNPYDIVIETRNVGAGDTLTLPLATSGGAAVRFTLKQE